LCEGEGEVALIGAARSHCEFDAPHASPHQRADLEELEADRPAGRLGELGGGAVRRAARKPSRQTTGAAGWRASSPPKCGQQIGRVVRKSFLAGLRGLTVHHDFAYTILATGQVLERRTVM
jgi:hypothetical protein